MPMIQEPVLFYNKNAEAYLGSLDTQINFSQLFVLTDENTNTHCLPLLIEWLGHSHFIEIQIHSGEEHKTIYSCTSIWQQLTAHKADRKALLLLLGGGVLTDMGAFAASCYKRGVQFLNIPTTLLAMVDASTGSKTGIDFDGLKNHIGLFSSPIATLIHQDFLKTLDQRQFKSGVCEMFKHGLIANASHWKSLVSNLNEPEKLVSDSVSIKIKIVTQDPTEKGLRKILNFGHTLGHAIETHFLGTSAILLHGEAIAAGIILESYLSSSFGELSAKALEEITHTINGYYRLPSFSKNYQQAIYGLMKHDKKNHKDAVNFVALTKIGEATYDANYTDQAIDQAFDFYNTLTYR